MLQESNLLYIARVNTERDWLMCGHVALDKRNVYPAPGNM
jgi:hypothetical protein